MNVCVCVYTSVCTGWLLLFPSSVIWHFQTLSETHIRYWYTTHVGLCSGCEPGMRSSHVTTACLFHLFRTINCAVPRKGALQCLFTYIALIPHFKAGTGITTDLPTNWLQSQRPWIKPLFEGFDFEDFSLLHWFKLQFETLVRRGNHFFQFCSTRTSH